MHQSDVLIVDNRVDCQIAFQTVLVADACNLAKVVGGEIVGRAGTHVQPLDAEIYSVGASLNRSVERLVGAYRGHYLKVFSVHILKFMCKFNANYTHLRTFLIKLAPFAVLPIKIVW